MGFSLLILHFTSLQYANQAKKARFRVTAAVTPLQKYFCVFSGDRTLVRSGQPENTLTEPQSSPLFVFISLLAAAFSYFCSQMDVFLLSDGCLHLFGEKLKERVFSLNRFPWGDSSCHPVRFRLCPENVAHSPKTKKAAGNVSVWERLQPLH